MQFDALKAYTSATMTNWPSAIAMGKPRTIVIIKGIKSQLLIVACLLELPVGRT